MGWWFLLGFLACVGGLAVYVDRFGQVDRVRPAQAIVVLGARVLPGGVASKALSARVEHGVSLYRRGVAPLIVLSGGVGKSPPSEAAVARGLAVSLGVKPEDILVEEDSYDTAQNAAFTARLLRERGIREVVLVSDPYHLLRAERHFRRVGLLPHPSPALRSERNLAPAERVYWTLREVAALLLRPWLLVG